MYFMLQMKTYDYVIKAHKLKIIIYDCTSSAEELYSHGPYISMAECMNNSQELITIILLPLYRKS